DRGVNILEQQQLNGLQARFFFSSRRRHTSWPRDWSSDVCSSDLNNCGQLYRFVPNAARDGLAFTSSALQDLVADNGTAICSAEMAEIMFGSGFGVVTDLENGPDGRLYVVSLSQGRVLRIGPKPGAVP